MKKQWRIALVVLAALIAASFAKDFAVKLAVENVAKLATGLNIKMRSMGVGIIRPVVDIRGLKILNPRGYKDALMLDMPGTYVNYDLQAILGGDMHLREMRIEMKEFVVAKNEKGEVNLNSLKSVQAQRSGKGSAAGDRGGPPRIRIDRLRLKLGKVLYKDYSGGGAPSVREFNININEEYKNIRDAYSLVSLIVARSLMNTNVASLSGFDLRSLQSSVSDALASAHKVAAETAQKTVVHATKQAEDAVKETSEKIAKNLKLPFGSE
jgi:hypothetical protein